MHRLLNGIFIIALLLIVLGFGLAAWTTYMKSASVPKKGFMQLAKVWFNNKQFAANDRLTINLWIRNLGDGPVDNMFTVMQARLVRPGPNADAEVHSSMLTAALHAHDSAINSGQQGISVGRGDGVWETLTLPEKTEPPLPQSQVDDILAGRQVLYLHVWSRWRDAPKDLDFCESLQTPTTNKIDSDALIWHACLQ